MSHREEQNDTAARAPAVTASVGLSKIRTPPTAGDGVGVGRSRRSRLATPLLLLAASSWSACLAQPIDDSSEAETSGNIAGQDAEDKLLQGVRADGLWNTKTIRYCFGCKSAHVRR